MGVTPATNKMSSFYNFKFETYSYNDRITLYKNIVRAMQNALRNFTNFGDTLQAHLFPWTTFRNGSLVKNPSLFNQLRDLVDLIPSNPVLDAFFRLALHPYVSDFFSVCFGIAFIASLLLLVFSTVLGVHNFANLFFPTSFITTALNSVLNEDVINNYSTSVMFGLALGWVILTGCIFFNCFESLHLSNVIIYFLFLWIGVIIFIPIFLIIEMGFFFIIFVRGAGGSKSLVWEYINDVINLIAFFLRIVIQIVRLVLIIVAMYTYHELYQEYGLPLMRSSAHGFRLDSFFSVSFLIKCFFQWIYEAGHFLGLLSVQFSVFIFVVLILVSFLYLQHTWKELSIEHDRFLEKWSSKE